MERRNREGEAYSLQPERSEGSYALVVAVEILNKNSP